MADIVQLQSANETSLANINTLLSQLTPGRSCSPEHLKKVVENPTTELWVVQEGGSILGMVTVALIVKPGGITVQLEDVVVDESARGRGFGQALCEKAIGRARALGARSVHLTSRPDRVAANHLYKKLGFEKRETNVYRLGL